MEVSSTRDSRQNPLNRTAPMHAVVLGAAPTAMRSVCDATLSPVNDAVLDSGIVDPAILSVYCWSKEGEKGCPDIKGTGVPRFREVITQAVRRAAQWNENRTRARAAPDSQGVVGSSAVRVHYADGGSALVPLAYLLYETSPCERSRDGYSCKNPNYVTEAAVEAASRHRNNRAALCQLAEELKRKALIGAVLLAEAHKCPSNLKSLSGHCPFPTPHPYATWELQLAIESGQPGGSSSIWVGAIVTVAMYCTPSSDRPPPESRQPEDPQPPESGGGTPTPSGRDPPIAAL